MQLLQRIEWRIYKERKRWKLKNHNPSIIASNCNGGIIYADLGLPFLSPTINLAFDMNDYVKFLGNLEWYLQQPIVEYHDSRYTYPTGLIGDIELLFVHYESFDEAVKKWEERKQRINWNNLFIIAIDGDGCTYETIEKFENLPYKNKVIFTHRKYDEFKSAYYISGFEDQSGVSVLLYFKKQYFIRRYLDDFDYVNFLNGKGIGVKK